MYKHLTEIYNNKKSITYTKFDLIKSALTTYHVSRMYQENVRNFKVNESLYEFS